MTTRVMRRARGTRLDTVQLHWHVERAAKSVVDAAAQQAGVSSAVMFEAIMDRLEVDPQGVPVWWEPLARDEELPISSA